MQYFAAFGRWRITEERYALTGKGKRWRRKNAGVSGTVRSVNLLRRVLIDRIPERAYLCAVPEYVKERPLSITTAPTAVRRPRVHAVQNLRCAVPPSEKFVVHLLDSSVNRWFQGVKEDLVHCLVKELPKSDIHLET